MNIFALHQETKPSAIMHCDKHCVKMIVEYAQLMSTAHRFLDGEYYAGKTVKGHNIKRYRMKLDIMENNLYKASHINHPSAVWVRQSKSNYEWLYSLGRELMKEYTFRYDKNHACEKLIPFLENVPNKIGVNQFTMPTPAMPEIYKVSCVVESYRNYYRGDKRRFATWKNRSVPEWF